MRLVYFVKIGKLRAFTLIDEDLHTILLQPLLQQGIRDQGRSSDGLKSKSNHLKTCQKGATRKQFQKSLQNVAMKFLQHYATQCSKNRNFSPI